MEIKINEPWITDKVRIQNGYAYIDHPFWNAEKQQADHKREYIGTWILGNMTRNARHELPKTLDFTDWLPIST